MVLNSQQPLMCLVGFKPNPLNKVRSIEDKVSDMIQIWYIGLIQPEVK